VVKVDLGLRNRELSDEADLEALLADLRQRLMEQLRAGVRLRLV
jgi:fructose-bisphosphate aldolase class 1